MTTVAILGLGIMGAGMAHRLVEQGFDVAVWNRNPAKAAPLGEAGARVAATPAGAVRGAVVVIAMLAQDDASRAVWLGEDGALPALEPDAVAIECSTLTQGWTAELATAMQARGIGFLDAPVTGSRVQAATGALRFLVGGEASVLERARTVLAALGGEAVHLGPTGSGATLKLINNYLCGVQVASLAEAVGAIERSGLDPAVAIGILVSGAPGSPIVTGVSGRMVARDYDDPHFLVPLMAKDLAYAGQALKDLGIDSAIAAAARERFLNAERAGHGARDIAAIVEPLRPSD